MTSVTQFAQYLLRLDPQKSPARLALYNYVKHILDPLDPFTPLVIEKFYAQTLNYEYWQTNSQSLSNEVREVLALFLRQTKIDEKDYAQIRHADEIQVITLKQFRDFEDLVLGLEDARRKSGDRMKLIKISETEVASLYLSTLGTLEVKVFGPRAMVLGRRLTLLAPISHLYYSSSMELMPHVRQLLQGSLMTTISFFLDEQGLNGLISRGHTFQKFETFMRAKPNDNHDLFCSLKKLERNFINPQSDPFYQDLIGSLERANRLVQEATGTIHLPAAEKALQKGALALRNAFPNDRLLQLLVTHLEYGIRQARIQTQGDPSGRETPHSFKQVPR
jgi:hypothetical protein